jgi:hypothetical protein
MNDLLSIIYRPRFEFKAVKDNQVNYVIVLLILVLLTIIQGVVFFPVQEQLMAHSDVFANMPPEQAEKAKSMGETMKYFGLLMAGMVYIIKILVQALMVWGGIAIFKGKINYKQSILVVSLVSFITILGDFANVGLIFLSGVEHVTSMSDVSKTGLNLLFDPEALGLPMYTFFAYINPFQVWGIILLIIGLKVVGELQTSNATILCLILWLIWVAFPVLSLVVSEAAGSKAGPY